LHEGADKPGTLVLESCQTRRLRPLHPLRGQKVIELRNAVFETGHRRTRAYVDDHGFLGEAGKPAIRSVRRSVGCSGTSVVGTGFPDVQFRERTAFR